MRKAFFYTLLQTQKPQLALFLFSGYHCLRMSTAVQKFHEEEAIEKTYDFKVAKRLLGYLRPYIRILIPALLLTLVLNLLGILQPQFTKYAIDW